MKRAIRTIDVHHLDRHKGALLGLAIGDALGAQVEFRARDSYPRVTEMTGGGPFKLEPGGWTDDTSMALALASSLLGHGGTYLEDQVQRYVAWMRRGAYSHTKTCFDIGAQTSAALQMWQAGYDIPRRPTPNDRAGNGAVMRLAPVPLFYASDHDAAVRHSAESALVTHSSVLCWASAAWFGRLLWVALDASSKAEVLHRANWAGLSYWLKPASAAQRAELQRLDCNRTAGIPRAKISSSGYVIDSLEAALWAFQSTDSFEDAIVLAVNLGGDTDTIGAITGQLAGAFYGFSKIPRRWVDTVLWSSHIVEVASHLYLAAEHRPTA